MKVNYVLMYGIPYVRYRNFETFENISKFLVNKSIVNYSIFKKLEDKEEIEMIYRDNDIHYLENLVKEQEQKLQQKENREYIELWHYRNDFRVTSFTTGVKKELLEILDKENK